MSACRRVKMLPVFRHEVARHPAVVVEEKIADRCRCLHRARIVYPTSSMRLRNMWLLTAPRFAMTIATAAPAGIAPTNQRSGAIATGTSVATSPPSVAIAGSIRTEHIGHPGRWRRSVQCICRLGGN
jgi:hypothetical protein